MRLKTLGHHEEGRENVPADVSGAGFCPHGLLFQVVSAILIQFSRGDEKNE